MGRGRATITWADGRVYVPDKLVIKKIMGEVIEVINYLNCRSISGPAYPILPTSIAGRFNEEVTSMTRHEVYEAL